MTSIILGGGGGGGGGGRRRERTHIQRMSFVYRIGRYTKHNITTALLTASGVKCDLRLSGISIAEVGINFFKP